MTDILKWLEDRVTVEPQFPTVDRDRLADAAAEIKTLRSKLSTAIEALKDIAYLPDMYSELATAQLRAESAMEKLK